MKRFCLVLFLAAGCWAPTVEFVRTNPPPHPLKPRPVDEVAVFTTTAPERPYVEVAIITSETGNRTTHGSPMSTPGEMIEALRQKGAVLGCDGLVVKPGSGDSWQGTCLVYK